MDKIDVALDLIKFNKTREKWNADLSDPKTSQLVYTLMNDIEFFQIMDAELLENVLESIFVDLGFINKEDFTREDATIFVNQIKRNLEINVKDYFVLIPVLGAHLSETIEISGELAVIAGDRNNKIGDIARLTGYNIQLIDDNLQHTERSRSKFFLHHPLILLKVRHQFGTVLNNSEFLGFYLMNFIKLIYWSYVYPGYKKKGILEGFKTIEEVESDKIKNVNRHVVVLGESNWGHRPISFDYDFKYSLDWLNDEKFSVIFLSLINLVDLKKIPTEIGSMFLRAIRMFNNSIRSGSNSSNRFYDIEADMILMLTIAAETVLLKSQEERSKQKKVRGRLMRLTNLYDINYKEEHIRDLINQMYRVRSGYVHEGIYQGYSEISSPEKDIEIYRKIIGRILCDANDHTENVLNISENSREPEKEIWNKIVSNNLTD